MQPPDDETHLADPSPPPRATADPAGISPCGADAQSAGSDSHRLGTTSDGSAITSDVDHGRFVAGALPDQRFRILGRLGKSGMGKVYRVDDLRLAWSLALTFLPEAVQPPCAPRPA